MITNRVFLARWCVTFAFAVLLLLATGIDAADGQKSPDSNPAGGAKGKPNTAVLSILDPAIVAENIPLWLKQWREPSDGDMETRSVSALFGMPTPSVYGGSFTPPDNIKRLLLERGLQYHWPESRRTAVIGFGYLLTDQPELLLPILRDAMNDPNADVRRQAVDALDQMAAMLFHKGSRDEATLARIAAMREGIFDETVDLAATKGLADRNDGVVAEALSLLESKQIKPTKNRFRALKHGIAIGRIPKYQQERVRELVTNWTSAIYGGERIVRPRPPQTNPFGCPAVPETADPKARNPNLPVHERPY